MKKILIGAVALTSVFALSACSSGTSNNSGGTDNSAAAGGETIALVAKADSSDYWTAVKEGAEKAGQELGVNISWVGPATETEPEKQLQQLEAAITAKPIGIAYAPQDGAQAQAPEYLDKAKAANINVVAFDTPVANSDVPIATIASDNKQIGAMAADHMIELTGGKGTIGVVAHGEVGTAADRRDGFLEEIKAKAPDMTVLPVQNGNSDQAESRTKASGMLTSNPDLVGMFGTDDDSVIAIADEVAAKGSKAVVIGVDASPDEISLVKEGKITGGITQNPGGIGYQAVKTLYDAYKGTMPTEKNIVSPAVWYTKDNLDSPEVKEVIKD
ncbi:MAG: substrate-binding domain-containing protein [Propionibacteriaceae bacterium]|nr:substrate-binding domain-containing protein [Propionibacteriaceae bacterium]